MRITFRYPLFIHISIEVDVRNKKIQNGTSRINHQIRELWTDIWTACLKRGKSINKSGHDLKRASDERDATDGLYSSRIDKFEAFTCFTMGHKNWTWPPPRGAVPRLVICSQNQYYWIEMVTARKYILATPSRPQYQMAVNEVGCSANQINFHLMSMSGQLTPLKAEHMPYG